MLEKSKSNKKLTDFELKIMNVVWSIGETTIPEVNRILNENKKNHAYTTTATMMKILEKKKFLKSIKKNRAHKYFPIVTKETYEGNAIHHIIDNVFQGDSVNLVMKLLDETQINQEELKKIRKSLETRISHE